MKNKVLIVAELSANHNGSLKLALDTLSKMKEAGADAVKVQTYKPESLTLDLSTGYFASRTSGPWKGYTPWKLYSEAALPYEWHIDLKNYAEELGLTFFSSPFDFEAVDFLESINIQMYKIASFEITDTPLIKYVASKGKPVIISTGVAEVIDIEKSIQACLAVGNEDITLLKCTSEYPARIEDANLLTMLDMRSRFGVKIGLSDHTMGHSVACAAVSMGAQVIEKHFIIDRSLGGPDAGFSMEPEEFKNMVLQIREIEKMFGSITYDVKEENKLRRRSLFVTNDIKKGECLTINNIRSIRPGVGLHPDLLHRVIGKKVLKDLKKGEPLQFDHFESTID